MQVLTPGLNIGGPAPAGGHFGPLIGFGPMIFNFILKVGTVAVGDVMQIDVMATDTGVTTQDSGSTGIFGSLIVPRAGLILQQEPGAIAVVTDLLTGAGADLSTVKACIYGKCQAFCIGASGSMTIANPLVVTTAKNFDIVVATGERHFAQAAGALTTPTTRTLGDVFVHNNSFPWGPSQAA